MARCTCAARGPVARVDYVPADAGYVVHFGPVSVRLDSAALDSLLVTLIEAHEARSRVDERAEVTTPFAGVC